MGFTATRTRRNTWHVLNTDTLEHFEAATQAEVEEGIKLYAENADKREAERKAAEEAAKNPTLAEFGSGNPIDAIFEHNVGSAGKANEPVVADSASPSGLSDEEAADFAAWQAKKAAAAGTSREN